MTKPASVDSFATTLPTAQRTWAQSLNNVLQGNIDMGTPTGNAPSSAGVNAGVYTQFQQGNGSGVLIRVAAAGVTGTGAQYNWNGTAGTGIVINHGLLRKPIGFQVVDADGTASISRTAAPDTNQITLTTTAPAVSNTLYIF
jgi:hypothetical protein